MPQTLGELALTPRDMAENWNSLLSMCSINAAYHYFYVDYFILKTLVLFWVLLHHMAELVSILKYFYSESSYYNIL